MWAFELENLECVLFECFFGGAYRTRTDDPHIANVVL